MNRGFDDFNRFITVNFDDCVCYLKKVSFFCLKVMFLSFYHFFIYLLLIFIFVLWLSKLQKYLLLINELKKISNLICFAVSIGTKIERRRGMANRNFIRNKFQTTFLRGFYFFSIHVL